MKVNVACRWTDDDMNAYPKLRDRDFNLWVSTDAVRDSGDLMMAIADAVYEKYHIALRSTECVKRIIKDLESTCKAVFDR